MEPRDNQHITTLPPQSHVHRHLCFAKRKFVALTGVPWEDFDREILQPLADKQIQKKIVAFLIKRSRDDKPLVASVAYFTQAGALITIPLGYNTIKTVSHKLFWLRMAQRLTLQRRYKGNIKLRKVTVKTRNPFSTRIPYLWRLELPTSTFTSVLRRAAYPCGIGELSVLST